MAFKKYQCRYFHSDGRPRIPNCNQGRACRFLHPEDEEWPGLKPKSQEKRAYSGPLLLGAKDLPNKPHPNSPSYRPEPRSAPLLPQDDLFLRRKLAEDEKYEKYDSRRMSLGHSDRDDFNNLDRGSGREGKRAKEDSSSRSGGGNSSRPYDNVSYLGVKRPTGSNRPVEKARVTSEKRKRVDDPDPMARARARSCSHLSDRPRLSNDCRDTSSINPLVLPKGAILAPGTANDAAPPTGSPTVEERIQRAVALFRELARLSSNVAQDAEDQAKDDKKLKAYTELSSMLSKVSSTAAAAVMPPLADILLRHAQGKQRTEANLNAIAGVWNQAVDMFVTEVSHAVDAKLASAVKKIREEAELVQTSTVLQNSISKNDTFSSDLPATQNRSRDDDRAHRSGSRAHLTPDNQATETDTDRKRDRDRDSKRDHKRRRFSSASPGIPETKPPQSALDVTLGASMQEILSQMKTKIDEQAQSLQNLMKENNELKASLEHRPSLESWTSFPFSTNAVARQGPGQVN